MKNRLRLVSVVVLGMMFFSLANAQKEKYMAAYIYQFTRYIDWSPAFKSGDFVIVVIGDAPMFDALQSIAQTKKIGTQNVVVKNYKVGKELPDANIIFISSSQNSQIQFVLGQINNNSTLIITEQSGMAKKGAAISFLEEGDKLTFEINKNYFMRQNLTINNSLLTLARNTY